MTLDMLLKIGSTAAIILSFALNLYLFFKSRSDDRFDRINDRADRIAKALADEIAERREQASDITKSHAVLAATVNGLPTHDDLGDIRDALNSLARNVASVDQRSAMTLNSLTRIEGFLMERGK